MIRVSTLINTSYQRHGRLRVLSPESCHKFYLYFHCSEVTMRNDRTVLTVTIVHSHKVCCPSRLAAQVCQSELT